MTRQRPALFLAIVAAACVCASVRVGAQAANPTTSLATAEWAKIPLVNCSPSEVLSYFDIPETMPEARSAAEDKRASKRSRYYSGILPLPHSQKALRRLPKGILGLSTFDMDNSLIVKGTEAGIAELKAAIFEVDIPPRMDGASAGIYEFDSAQLNVLAPYVDQPANATAKYGNIPSSDLVGILNRIKPRRSITDGSVLHGDDGVVLNVEQPTEPGARHGQITATLNVVCRKERSGSTTISSKLSITSGTDPSDESPDSEYQVSSVSTIRRVPAESVMLVVVPNYLPGRSILATTKPLWK